MVLERWGLLSGPEGPEPALGSLGVTCSVVMREIHYNADVALASRPSVHRVAPGRRAVRSLTDDLEA